MKKLFIILLAVTASVRLFAQGGTSCATAQANPITLGNSYSGQSTCTSLNSYTGANICPTMSTLYYSANDYYYYFCAAQTGCVTISMNNVTTGTPNVDAYPSLSVFTACPGTAGACVTASYAYISYFNPPSPGPSVSFNVIAGQCYYVLVDGYYDPTWYASCVNYTLATTFTSPTSQTPGGNTCAAAVSSPITLGNTYTGQTTCCASDDYTGTGGCFSPSYYTSNDWFYYFCATSNGYASITLNNISAGSQGAYPMLSVFQGCPGTGTCVAYQYAYISPSATGSLSVTVQVNTGQCFYVVVDGYYYPGSYADCISYDLSTSIIANTVQPSCTNMGFDAGNLTGWFPTTGTSTTGPVTSPTPIYTMTNVGAVAGRHTIVSSGTDPCGGFSQVAPGGAPSSLRLGNNLTGAEAEQISQTFTVSNSNASFTYMYAVVLEDPNHQPYEQPFFQAILKDQNGNIIQCSQYIVAAGPGSGFTNSTTCTGAQYKPWTTVNVDLSGYIGQNVTVEFTVGDCTQGGHYGYAYIDAFCAPSLLQANNDTICVGQSATLSAPAGYQSYLWQPGNSTAQSITVTPAATTVYTLTLTALNGCPVIHHDTIWVENTPAASFTYNAPTCANPNVTFTSTSTVTPPAAISTYNWTFPGGTPSSSTAASPTVTWGAPGTYTVTLSVATGGGCAATTTQAITVPPCPSSVSTMGGTICAGQCITLTATGATGSPPITYNWQPGNLSGASVNVCPASTTTYTVTATDANNVSTTDTAIVTVNPVPTIAATTTNVSCNGGTDGTATANPSGGPPFTYSWNTTPVQTTQTATGLAAGSYIVTVTNAGGCTATATVTITQPTALTASASSTNVSCSGGSNGTATASSSGGTGTHTYSWNTTPVQTTQTATGLAAGTYIVTVTDANNCTATASVTITQPTAISASTTVVNSICNQPNGSATVSASGGTGTLTYSWNTTPVQTTATATGLIPGTYVVTVTDANSCTTTATATVGNNNGGTASITSANVNCNGGSDGTATANMTGGTPPFSYSWNTTPVQTTQTATGLAAGTYIVTVTDANTCVATATVTITEPALLIASTTTVNSICGQPNGSASATPAGGTGTYTYSWNTTPAQTTQTATGLLPGTYTVTVTDANNCMVTATAVVGNTTAGTASITAVTNVSCNGGSDGAATVTMTGGASPFTYSWNTAPVQTTQTATGLAAGTYIVTITDNNNCAVTATATITEPTAVTASITSFTDVLCNGGNNGSATVSSSGGTGTHTYSWNTTPLQTTATASGLTAGTYIVTVTDANSCSTTVSVTISEPAALSLATAGFAATCNNACDGQAVCIPAGGTGPTYTFSWSTTPVQTTASANNLCAGTYSVTVTDMNGCTLTDTAVVTEPSAIALNTSVTNAYCNQANGTATVNASGGTPAYTYSWSTTPVQTTATATSLIPGTYSVIVTDFNGCADTITAAVPNIPGVTASISGFTNVSTCFGGNNGTATAATAGGTAPFAYSWNTTPVQTTQTATGLSAGSYIVTITDSAGCTSTATATIGEPTPVDIAPLMPATICIGQSTSLSATISGGTPGYTATWIWSSGTQTGNPVTVSPAVTTTYTVTAADANNCPSDTQTVVVTVNPPLAVVATGTDSICPGGNTPINAAGSGGNGGPYFYSWSPATGLSNPNIANPSASPSVTTTYTVTVTDNCTSTPATATVTVTVNPVPVVAVTSDITAACAPACVNFSDLSTIATGSNVGWSWDFGDTQTSTQQNPQNCYGSAGTYLVTLTVTSDEGCTSTLAVPYVITMYPEPVADFIFGPQPTTILAPEICFTDSSQGAVSWSWDFGDAIPPSH
jgi:PKD repeat protein